MSLKIWCILGMIATALVGWLRIKGSTGTGKTAIIIIHTVGFVLFLICVIALHNQGM